MGQKRRLSNTIISFIIQRVHDLHISQIHRVCRSEFCVSIVIYFSWEHCYIQEESKIKVMQWPVKDAIGGGGEGRIYNYVLAFSCGRAKTIPKSNL